MKKLLIAEIVPEMAECPVCAERDYILLEIWVIGEGYLFEVTCLSCGYDNSMEQEFIWLNGFG
jgi:Zn ribbon nucleic-acid-binding protein